MTDSGFFQKVLLIAVTRLEVVFFVCLLSACAHIYCQTVCFCLPLRYSRDKTPGDHQSKWSHWASAWQRSLLCSGFTHLVASASICADRHQWNIRQHCRYCEFGAVVSPSISDKQKWSGNSWFTFTKVTRTGLPAKMANILMSQHPRVIPSLAPSVTQ